jgi:citronellol/citronellal dehydrogenase
VSYELGGDAMTKKSRNDLIMADSAYEILTSHSKMVNGQFFIDDEVMASVGCENFDKYKVDASVPEDELFPDFFLETKEGVLAHLKGIREEAAARRK